MNLFKLFLSQKGQAAIEFISIIPFLFIFFYAVLEFSLLFVHDQRVSALSRETANAAFRDCATLQGTPLTDCLQAVVDTIQAGGEGVQAGGME